MLLYTLYTGTFIGNIKHCVRQHIASQLDALRDKLYLFIDHGCFNVKIEFVLDSQPAPVINSMAPGRP